MHVALSSEMSIIIVMSFIIVEITDIIPTRQWVKKQKEKKLNCCE